jgi:CelD/BcsL family acetyltransferase involved in cellulose biosynthesis
VTYQLHFDALSERSRAQRLEPEWIALWERCPSATPFLLPEWQLASWQNFAQDRPRTLVSARADGVLVGIALFRESREGDLVFEGEEVSDYQDLLVEPLVRPHFVNKLLAWMRIHGRGQDFRLERLPPGSPLTSSALPAPWIARRGPQDVCPFVAIPEGARELDAVIPRGFLRRIEQMRRVAARRFDVQVVEAQSTSWPAHLSALFRLHAQRWQLRGQSGVLVNPAVQAFHREVVPKLLARRRLRLFELRFDDRPAASLYALYAHGRIAYYVGGFEPEFARLSPGRLLICHLFQEAMREGATEIDFLRGVERYKYDWGATNRSTFKMTIEDGSSPRHPAGWLTRSP